MTEQNTNPNVEETVEAATEATEEQVVTDELPSEEEIEADLKQAMQGFDLSQLDPEFFLKKTLLDLIVDGKIINVAKPNDDIEARCFVFNRETSELTDVELDTNGFSVQAYNEETDNVIWLMRYQQYKVAYVYKGGDTAGFERIADGDLTGYYTGSDFAYLLSFLAAFDSTEVNIKDEVKMEKFAKISKIVSSVIGDTFNPVYQLLVNQLLHVENPEEFLVEWDKADKLETGQSIVYGATTEINDTEYVKFENVRAAYWLNPTVQGTDGELKSDDTLTIATLSVNTMHMPQGVPNSKTVFTQEEQIPEHVKAVLLITEDVLEGKLKSIKQFAREDFDISKTNASL